MSGKEVFDLTGDSDDEFDQDLRTALALSRQATAAAPRIMALSTADLVDLTESPTLDMRSAGAKEKCSPTLLDYFTFSKKVTLHNSTVTCGQLDFLMLPQPRSGSTSQVDPVPVVSRLVSPLVSHSTRSDNMFTSASPVITMDDVLSVPAADYTFKTSCDVLSDRATQAAQAASHGERPAEIEALTTAQIQATLGDIGSALLCLRQLVDACVATENRLPLRKACTARGCSTEACAEVAEAEREREILPATFPSSSHSTRKHKAVDEPDVAKRIEHLKGILFPPPFSPTKPAALCNTDLLLNMAQDTFRFVARCALHCTSLFNFGRLFIFRCRRSPASPGMKKLLKRSMEETNVATYLMLAESKLAVLRRHVGPQRHAAALGAHMDATSATVPWEVSWFC
jgi:hypothetical protein